MNQLNFLVEWNVKKERSWSGTNYSLYKALEQFYQVKDCPLSPIPLSRRIVRRFVPRLWDFGMSDIIRNRRNNENIGGKVLQFSEILDDCDTRCTYIYQDLCIDYLCYLYDNDLKTLNYSGYGRYSKNNILYRNIMQLEYFRHASGILMMGKWMADYLKNTYTEFRSKVYHVGGGINLDYKRIEPNPKKANNRILFVGRDFKRKGGYDVVKAFEIMRKKYQNLELHVAGPGINPIKDVVPGYYFYGDASKDTLQYLMNNCDVFCMPSYFEAYGLVFIEALVFGLPCVGRNRCEMPYFIEPGKTGELVDGESAEELAQKLEMVLNDTNYKRNIEDRRDYYLRKYSWDSVAKRIAEIIG